MDGVANPVQHRVPGRSDLVRIYNDLPGFGYLAGLIWWLNLMALSLTLEVLL
jgi:hypothetical protein